MKLKKYSKNPVIIPLWNNTLKETSSYNPATIVRDGRVFLLYRSEKGCGEGAVSNINLALSRDGFHFKRYKKNPVIERERLYEKRGCEDPRIIKIKKKFFLTYTAYEGRNKKGDYKIKLCGAFSRDLIHWKKIGPLIPGEKSGGIIQDYKYKGEYVMYFGGEIIKIAFSRDLKRWEILPRPVMKPRRGDFFDNHFTEVGPPPIITKEGIFLIYNGENRREFSVGFAIFDKNNPCHLIYRTEKPILTATEYWEKFGKRNNAIFATGLINFKKNWLLYYGGADKSIGVAIIKDFLKLNK